MLALGEPRSVDKIILVPTKPWRAQSHPIERNERAPYETGFVERPYKDENDLPPNLRRAVKSRRFGPGAW
jgi:hypothetical protein